MNNEEIIMRESEYFGYVNIYTDTSDRIININDNEIRITAPGFIVTYNSRIIFQLIYIYVDAYTIFGEMKAIDMALDWINYMQSIGNRFKYNIFCDNNPVTIILNKGLIKNETNKSDSPTKILGNIIVDKIKKSNALITIYYVPGHIPVNNGFGFSKHKKKFFEFNSVYHNNLKYVLNDQMIFEAATYNNVIDMTTRNYLFQNMNYIIQDLYNMDLSLILRNKNNPSIWPFQQKYDYNDNFFLPNSF